MFFIMGINDGRKDFDFCQTIVCAVCGKYGRYQVFMTYTVLSLFFIPCFKWNRHYYVQTTCCNTVYELDPATGRRIAAGEDIEITEDDMTMVHNGGWRSYSSAGSGSRQCSSCGFTTDEDYEYCPRCGRRLD